MEDTSGFYKWDDVNNKWWWAPTAVYSPTLTLKRELKVTYEYPVDGWVWYDKYPENTESNLFFTAPITKP